MDQDYEKIEEQLKKKSVPKKKQKQSGRSVFKLQEIIKKKSEKDKEEGRGFRQSGPKQTLARDS